MTNKLFFAIIILVPLLMIGAGVYYFYGYQRPSSNHPAQEEVKAGEVALLVDEEVISPVLSFSRDTVWYMTRTGRLFRKNFDGGAAEEYILPAPLENPIEVLWQKDGSDFIVEENTLGHTRFVFYDSAANDFVQYSSQLRNPRFLPSGGRIVYDWATGSGGNELKVSDKNGDNFEKIGDLFHSDYRLEASPTADQAVLFSGFGAAPSGLQLVTLSTGNFESLGEKVGYDGVKFSPEGGKLIGAKLGQSASPDLVIFDLLTGKESVTGLSGNIEQASWNEEGTEVIVAGEAGISGHDVNTGAVREIHKWREGQKYSARDLILVSDKSLLIFVDQESEYLYQISL